MPYITQEDRPQLNKKIDELVALLPLSTNQNLDGKINYIVTTLLQRAYNLPYSARYPTFNRIMGVLTCIGMEFYRRAVSPYEDRKIIQNGDAFIKEHTDEHS